MLKNCFILTAALFLSACETTESSDMEAWSDELEDMRAQDPSFEIGAERALVEAKLGVPFHQILAEDGHNCSFYKAGRGFVREAVYRDDKLVAYNILQNFGLLVCDPSSSIASSL